MMLSKSAWPPWRRRDVSLVGQLLPSEADAHGPGQLELARV